MENIKFYYLEDEFEPIIIIIDDNNHKAYSVNRLDITNINETEYPSNKSLKHIISKSLKEGFDGSWNDIRYILDEPEILENFILTKNINIPTSNKKEETSNDKLIERFWERFENQSTKTAIKYSKVYEKSTGYLKSLTNSESNVLLFESNILSDKEYFYLILKHANISNKITESDFSF